MRVNKSSAVSPFLPLFIAPSLSLLHFVQTNEWAEEEGVEVWNAGTGSVFWLKGPSEPHADRVHWERHAIKHTHSTNVDHLDELSFLQHAGPGMPLSQHTVKEKPQILSLFFLLFAFQPIFVPGPSVIHTQTVWSFGLWTNYVIPAVPSPPVVVLYSLRSSFRFDDLVLERVPQFPLRSLRGRVSFFQC